MTSKAVLVVVLVLLGAVAAIAAPHVGGVDDEKPANEEVRKIVMSVNSLIREKYPNRFCTVEPVSYKKQIVAGTNFFVRAVVTERDNSKRHVHLRIYRPIRGPNELTAIKTDVDKDTPLCHFN